MINDVKNDHISTQNLYVTSLYPSFNYGYFYSIQFTFLRPSKAVEKPSQGSEGFSLYLTTKSSAMVLICPFPFISFPLLLRESLTKSDQSPFIRYVAPKFVS